jgi:hypothetical protein
MSTHRPHTPKSRKLTHTIEFIPGRIDSPEDFPRPSVYLELKVVQCSAYLSTKIGPHEQNGTGPISRIELPSANPKAFETYAHWLKTGLINLPTRQISCAATIPPHSLSWRDCEVLVKAHILGSQFGDEAFQDCVMNVLVKCLKPEQSRDSRICGLVFGRQASGVSQKLKCLVVDQMFADELEGNELLAIFVERVLEGKVGDMALGSTCEYHVHENDRCKKKYEDLHEGDWNSFTTRTMVRSRSSVHKSALDIEERADIVMKSPCRSRTKSKRKPVPDPSNFSARSRVPRIFDEISLEPNTPHIYAGLPDLPSPQRIHPSLLRGIAATVHDKDDGQCESRPPSRSENSLSPRLPSPLSPKIHPILLEGLSSNQRLLAGTSGVLRRPSTAVENQELPTRRESHRPLRPPTPFPSAPPSTHPASRLPSQQAQKSQTSCYIADLPQDWPLHNFPPTFTPLPLDYEPTSSRRIHHNPSMFPSTGSHYDRSATSCTERSPSTSTNVKQERLPLSNRRRRRTSLHEERPLPPLPISRSSKPSPTPPLRKQVKILLPLTFHLDPNPASLYRTTTPKRKPTPKTGLDFLSRYPEGETLISRASESSLNLRDRSRSRVRKTVPQQLPVELQGRAVRLADLMIGEGRGRLETA